MKCECIYEPKHTNDSNIRSRRSTSPLDVVVLSKTKKMLRFAVPDMIGCDALRSRLRS